MFPADRSRLAQSSMRLARQMVGTNETVLGEEAAMSVFRAHGGVIDADGAPMPGTCNTCPGGGLCEMQRLAFAVLMAFSVFKTSQEMLVADVVRQLREEIMRGY